MLGKYALFITGIGFLFSWLIFLGIAFASKGDETPRFGFFLAVVTSLFQAATFTLYRSDSRQRIIGGMILAIMAVSLAALFITNIGGFAGYFLAVSFASAVLHTFYGFLVNEERKTVKPRSGAPISQQR